MMMMTIIIIIITTTIIIIIIKTKIELLQKTALLGSVRLLSNVLEV